MSEPKKAVSERRRMQNKQAQKNYRERQKKNLQALQNIAISSHGFRVSGPSVDDNDTAPPLAGIHDAALNLHTGTNASHRPIFPELSNTSSDHLTISQQSSSHVANENPDVTRLLEQEGINLDEQTRAQLMQKKVSLRSLLEAGVRAVTQEPILKARSTLPDTDRSETDIKLRTDKIIMLRNSTPRLPDIHRNNIRIKQVMWVAACMANANILGFNLKGAECDDYQSSFFRENISESAAKSACMSYFGHLSTYLQPTATQMMYQHHPYLDVLPFPTFRDGVIKLAYAEEDPMIDEDDLCEDLQNDGLICWGSSLGGGSAAMGSGAPWDVRSWEAQPWFLKKWWILIGGADGEIYKQTKWWCEMRGERFCNPW